MFFKSDHEGQLFIFTVATRKPASIDSTHLLRTNQQFLRASERD
jgi:hypothetical protein